MLNLKATFDSPGICQVESCNEMGVVTCSRRPLCRCHAETVLIDQERRIRLLGFQVLELEENLKL